MTEIYTSLDVRDMDCTHLATIGDADYYELHQILRVRSSDGKAIIGRASDWPVLMRDAEIAELKRRIAELEQIIETTPAAVPTPPRERSLPPKDGGKSKRIECAICKALVWPKLFDDHMARHTRIDVPEAAPEPEPAWTCQQCGATDSRSVTEPSFCKPCVRERRPPIRLAPDNPAWHCAEPGCSGAFTRSLTSPDYCIKHAPPVTNGHQVAA